MKNTKVDWIDAEELAKAILKLDSNADSQEIEDQLFEKFEISFDQFHQLVEVLAKYTPIGQTAVMGNLFRGFIHNDNILVKIDP